MIYCERFFLIIKNFGGPRKGTGAEDQQVLLILLSPLNYMIGRVYILDEQSAVTMNDLDSALHGLPTSLKRAPNFLSACKPLIFRWVFRHRSALKNLKSVMCYKPSR
jgi:hypothetical protein